MSSFHHDIEVLVHLLKMETLMDRFNPCVSERIFRIYQSKLKSLDNAKDNRFSYYEAHGDTFKRLFLTVNSLKSLLCKKNQDGSMI